MRQSEQPLSESLGFTSRMVRRERLVRFGARATALANARRVRLAGQLLLLVGLGFIVVRLRSMWQHGDINVGHVRWAYLAAAAAVAACVIAGSGFVWLAILKQLGVVTRPAWASIFAQAQLAKYVPGSVWQYAGRLTLAQSHGIAVRPVATSLPLELAASAAAAAVFSILLVGWWGLVGVIVLFGALVVVDAKLPRDRAVLRAGVRATELYGAVWVLVGTSFWLTARAFVSVPSADVPRYFGAFATAWVVGLVAIYAPGGVGVREAILVGLLRGKTGSADAIVIAAASRVVLTFVDLVSAAVAFVVLRSRRPPADAVSAPPIP
jgi:glycosyltransferase 2 family protein